MSLNAANNRVDSSAVHNFAFETMTVGGQLSSFSRDYRFGIGI